MRKYLIIIVTAYAVLLAGCGRSTGKGDDKSAAQISDSSNAVISFNEIEHDFGKINEGEKVGFIFTFRNTGTDDLIINSVITSCGCTISKYSRKPIAPGKEGTLEVVFDSSGKRGFQHKTITVKSNAKIPQMLLRITAEVNNTSNN